MAFNVTPTVATFSGQNHLNRTSNNLPKALERPAPDVKSKDHSKGRDTTPELPAPDVKINFSSKGREAALNQPAPDVKISSAAKERETKSEQPKPDVKGNRRTEELTGRLASKPQQTQSSELQTVIKETTKAIKQVQAGEGALKEVNNIALKARDQVLNIAKKHETGGKDKEVLNQKEIARALKNVDRLADAARRTYQKLSVKPVGKTDNAPIKDVLVSVGSPNQKTGTSEVKATPAIKTEPTTSKTPTELKNPQAATSNVPATNQANEAAKTEATTKASAPAPSQLRATSQTAKPSSSQAINFGQIVLDQKGIIVSAGKVQEQPRSAASNLVPTLPAPARGLEAQTKELLGAISTSTISNDQPNEESEEKTTDTKKPSLFFQGGVSANQIANTLLDQTRTPALEGSAAGSLGNLRTISVGDPTSAQNSLLERVINDAESLRSNLGAFQTNPLESNANNLRARLGNQVSAASTIRDSAFAVEFAAVTKNQVLLQVNKAVLSNANQVPQLVANLLRG